MQLNKTNEGARGAAARIAEVASLLWEKGWAEASGGNISVNVTEFYPGIHIDFRTYPMIPLEVKYSYLKQPKVPSSLRSFISRYTPPKAYLINLSLTETLRIGPTEISILPYHELLRQTFIG